MHPATHAAAEPPSPVVALPGVDRRARTQRHITHGVRNPFAGPLSEHM